MKKTILFFFSCIVSFSIQAQIIQPTEWEKECQKEIEERAKIEARAKIGGVAPGDVGLTVERGNDANEDGFAIIGFRSGDHLSISNYDIQQRTADNFSTLYLNYFGGNVNIARGSDNEPTFTNIGTYSLNDGNLNAYNTLWAGGADRRVGIGTTNPNTKLHTIAQNEANTLIEVTSDGTQTTVGSGNALRIESLYTGIDINLNGEALNGTRYGIYNSNFISAPAGTTGSHYGGYFYTSGNRTGSNYSVYGQEAATPADVANWGIYCNGAGFITSSWSTSDRKLKKNIQNINDALDQINQLQPKSYTYDRVNYKNMNLPEGDQMGFIAQDLEQVFPSLIRDAASPEVTSEQAQNSDREPSPAVAFKAVNHQPLIALLTKGIQELSTQNEILQEQLNQQQQKNNQQQLEIDALRTMISELQHDQK